MHVISDENLLKTLIAAIKLHGPERGPYVVEMEGDGEASIAVGQQMLIKLRDFGRRIDCFRHPLNSPANGRAAVLAARELVRGAMADAAINLFTIKLN